MKKIEFGFPFSLYSNLNYMYNLSVYMCNISYTEFLESLLSPRLHRKFCSGFEVCFVSLCLKNSVE